MAKVATQTTTPASFGSILDRPSSEIERPKPLPVGTYVCVVKGLPRYDKSSKKLTDFVEFTLQPLQAGDDVDQEALQEMGGFVNKTLRATFYITEDAAWRLKKFLSDLGHDVDDEKTSLRQMISESAGLQVVVTVTHTSSDDGSAVYANVGMTAPVE